MGFSINCYAWICSREECCKRNREQNSQYFNYIAIYDPVQTVRLLLVIFFFLTVRIGF